MGAACTGQSTPKKILIIGPKRAGKTTCLYAWCSHVNTETVPTESFNVETIYGVRGGQLMLVWDVTDRLRRRQFYHGTDAVVYVVDSSDKASISSAQADIAAALSDRDLVNLPLLLVVSKQDMQCMTATEVEEALKMEQIIGKGKYACVGVSKTDVSSYRHALDKLCDLLYS